MTIKRYIPSAALAFGVTCGLGVFMAGMIKAEFTPQEVKESAGFEINLDAEDPPLPPERKPPTLKDKIETPPPPPVISREKAARPTERIASLDGAIPKFDPPTIDPGNFVVIVSDRQAQPLVRIPGIMPPRAEKSGHCKVRFDVSPEGSPFNIVATYCTQGLFERATIKSVQKWKFNPKIVNGRAVTMTGVENKVSYHLLDERGHLIPE